MATREVKFHDNRFDIISQVFCCTIHETWENRKAWVVMLRSLHSPTTGKPFFSYQCLAEAFAYKARQHINKYVREYAACDENLFDSLRHKRNVAPVVVNAVRDELHHDVLAQTGTLCTRVKQRLGREDLTAANIRTALEQIPCTVIRTRGLREMAAGTFHPKEQVVLAGLCAMLEHDAAREHARPGRLRAVRAVPALVGDGVAVNHAGASESDEARRPVSPASPPPASGTWLREAEIASHAGLEAIREGPDDAIIQHIQAACGDALLTPQFALSDIPEPVVQMVKAMALYASGASFSPRGRWFGGRAKSTMYTWILGMAMALWPVIQGWVWSHVTGKRQAIDETWLNIRKTWHYLFVSLDDDSGLPVLHDLLPTRTKWACRLFLLKLKRLGLIPVVMITDGLQGYDSAIAAVFPMAKHLWCLFHHQQRVTRCVNTQCGDTDQERPTSPTSR